jgi:hypothetical protein
LGYLVLLLFLGYVTHQWPAYWLRSGFLTLHSATAWFGALGGVAIGLYGLYTHIQARDFDPKFELSYVCKPVMGPILGWFVFLVILLDSSPRKEMNEYGSFECVTSPEWLLD